MGFTCIILSLAVLSWDGAETVEFRHGGETHFGTVSEQAGGQMVRFIEDAPWKDNPLDRSFRTDQVEYFRESSSHRERRHAEGWESRGFVNAARNGQSPIWVPRAESERAEQARAMLDALALPDEAILPAPSPESGQGMSEGATDGPAAYWPHALLIGTGLVLVVLITRTLILPG